MGAVTSRARLRATPWRSLAVLAGAAALALLALAGPAAATPGPTLRASVAGDETQADDSSGVITEPSSSRDGSKVTFESSASNLVAGDTNEQRDIFVRDLGAGTTTRVSVSSAGAQADAAAVYSPISADGGHVAFQSAASNLVEGDTNGSNDVFVRDLATSTTVRVSVATDGTQANTNSGSPSISADGRYIAFSSGDLLGDGPGAFVHDRDTDGDGTFDEAGATATVRVSFTSDGTPSDGDVPSISDDGKRVAFRTGTALVPEDTNGINDIYVRDLTTSTTIRASVPTDATAQETSFGDPSLSADGSHVAFASRSTNLVAGDNNGQQDIFVRDLDTSTTARVSVASDGTQSIGGSGAASISGDGRKVSFFSAGKDLVPGTNFNTHVFVRDRDTDGDGTYDEPGQTTLESVASDGIQGDSASVQSSISDDGKWVAYSSFASNLVANDTNNANDVFAHRLVSPAGMGTVVIEKAGDAQGTVTSSPAGIDCGETCFADFDSGAQVTLTATPASGYAFTGFNGGGCSGTDPCTVTVAGVKDVIATFERIRFALTIEKPGDGVGTVKSTPAGIDCGADCVEQVGSGEQVTLKATPGGSSTFSGFSGAGCSGTGPCTVTMDQAKTVTATFAHIRFPVTVQKAGNGEGTVQSTPGGIDCGADCTEPVSTGAEVTLTATPASGSTFTGFSGAPDCTGAGTTCTLTVDEATTVTATFVGPGGGAGGGGGGGGGDGGGANPGAGTTPDAGAGTTPGAGAGTTPGGGAGPVSPPSGPPARDTRAPRVGFGGRTTQPVSRLIAFTVVTDENASLTASGQVTVPAAPSKSAAGAARKGKIYRLASVRRKATAKKKVTFKMRLSGKALAAVKASVRRGGRSTAKIKVVATDKAGNKRTSLRTIQLTR